MAVERQADPDPHLTISLIEAMSTQRAIRRLRSDPVDDDVVLRCLELKRRGLRRGATGRAGSSWSSATRRSSTRSRASTGRRGRCTADSGRARPSRRDPAQDRGRRPVAGRPLRGSPGGRRALPPRPVAGLRPAGRGRELLRVDLPGRPEPASRRGGRPRRGLDHAAALVGHAGPAHPGPPADGDAGGGGPARLAERPLRPYFTPTGGRTGTPRPLWSSTIRRNGTRRRSGCGRIEGFPVGAESAGGGVCDAPRQVPCRERTSSPLP